MCVRGFDQTRPTLCANTNNTAQRMGHPALTIHARKVLTRREIPRRAVRTAAKSGRRRCRDHTFSRGGFATFLPRPSPFRKRAKPSGTRPVGLPLRYRRFVGSNEETHLEKRQNQKHPTLCANTNSLAQRMGHPTSKIGRFLGRWVEARTQRKQALSIRCARRRRTTPPLPSKW
jgi:hypothetical protein